MKHITSFTVKDNHRNTWFEVNNLQQFNLVFGDNGVGKSQLLSQVNQPNLSLSGRMSEIKTSDEDILRRVSTIFPEIQNYTARIMFEHGYGCSNSYVALENILARRDGIVVIDNLGYFLHPSRLHNFLQEVLCTAKECNNQLFMATHSYECIQFFTDILAREEMKDFRPLACGIKLAKLPKGDIKAYTANFEQLRATCKAGFDPRQIWN